MTKKEALLVLIGHSFLLTDKEKVVLQANIDSLSDDQIEQLGTLLALEKKSALETNPQIQKNIVTLMKDLRQHPPAKTL